MMFSNNQQVLLQGEEDPYSNAAISHQQSPSSLIKELNSDLMLQYSAVSFSNKAMKRSQTARKLPLRRRSRPRAQEMAFLKDDPHSLTTS